MKKVICLLWVFSLLLGLCGCGFSSVFASANREHLVSALGFEENENGVEIFIETITVNSENPEADSTVSVINGTGKSINAAFENALNKATLELRFSHCTAAVISSESGGNFLNEIFEFLYNIDQINLSVSVIAAQNVEEFLRQKPDSTIAVGFWVAEAIASQSEKTGAKFNNRLYQIEAARRGKENFFQLPLFGKIGEGILAVFKYKNDRRIEVDYGK